MVRYLKELGEMFYSYIPAGIGENVLWLRTRRNWGKCFMVTYLQELGKWFMVTYLQELGEMVYGYTAAGIGEMFYSYIPAGIGEMVYGDIPAGIGGNGLWLHSCRNWGNVL